MPATGRPTREVRPSGSTGGHEAAYEQHAVHVQTVGAELTCCNQPGSRARSCSWCSFGVNALKHAMSRSISSFSKSRSSTRVWMDVTETFSSALVLPAARECGAQGSGVPRQAGKQCSLTSRERTHQGYGGLAHVALLLHPLEHRLQAAHQCHKLCYPKLPLLPCAGACLSLCSVANGNWTRASLSQLSLYVVLG